MNIIIAIPTFNCGKHLVKVLNDFKKSDLDKFLTIAIFDNNSDDSKSPEILKLIRDTNKFKIFKNEKNYGLGGTFKLAWKFCVSEQADWMIFLHGDGQAPVENLPEFIANFEDQDLVLGSRFCKGSIRKNYSLMRTLGNFGFNVIFSIVCKRKITEIGSGLVAYRIKPENTVAAMSVSDHHAFDAEFLLWAFRKRKIVSFAPIIWIEDGYQSTTKNLKVGLILLVVLFKHLFSIKMPDSKNNSQQETRQTYEI